MLSKLRSALSKRVALIVLVAGVVLCMQASPVFTATTVDSVGGSSSGNQAVSQNPSGGSGGSSSGGVSPATPSILTVVKKVAGGTALPSVWTFTIVHPDGTRSQLDTLEVDTVDATQASATFSAISSGVYSIVENIGPASYVFSGIDSVPVASGCVQDVSVPVGAKVVLTPSAQVTCVFTSIYVPSITGDGSSGPIDPSVNPASTTTSTPPGNNCVSELPTNMCDSQTNPPPTSGGSNGGSNNPSEPTVTTEPAGEVLGYKILPDTGSGDDASSWLIVGMAIMVVSLSALVYLQRNER